MLKPVFWLSLLLCVTAQSFYDLLGIDRDSGTPEIKRAYRKIARLLHPDKNLGGDTTKRFQALSHAYTTLIDEEKRENYDLYGEEDPFLQPGGWRINQQYNFDDIWELHAGNFHSFVVQSSELWLIQFYLPWQQESRQHIPLWNKVAKLLKGVVRVGILNCMQYRDVCSQYKVTSTPVFLTLYRGKHKILTRVVLS
eukprot:TRINITY_DN16703_c0_g1_i1.p1 TRINITY_DN16703_c0_g1~~TRINITY_DN16703_c0_g1_i1.p1  ORF type:complete len:196 (-),score=13.29 TRINITY_DN16703_c0_g1_i1:751-1338(-)